MWTARTIRDAREKRHALTGSVALVPTMGALHPGHTSLIHLAKAVADHALVSIFVNPTQFNDPNDFDTYPRTTDADLQACRDAGTAGVFIPEPDEIYPPGHTPCEIDVPTLAHDLEAAHRPGHFQGVCRVVAKLLNIIQPSAACFGRKDYQQLVVIQAMVADLALPIVIVPGDTAREPDGLAMSSRNARLTPDARRHATGLYKALTEAKRLVEDAGETDPTAVESAMHHILIAYHVDPDYAQLRHPHTLGKLDCVEPSLTGGVVALVAGRVAVNASQPTDDNTPTPPTQVRLIDNMRLGQPTPTGIPAPQHNAA